MLFTGIIFTVCSEPYLLSEYGAEYMSEAPVKLLERLMHGERLEPDEQVLKRHVAWHLLV